MLSENKFRKYMFYAIGEIILVVIGILIAVQINSWHSKTKDDEDIYFLKRIDSIIEFVTNPNTTLEDIKVLAKNKPITGLRTVNRYNVNTFNILVSTGDISLFEDALIQKIMELNRLQNFEIDISEGNRASYFEMYNSYLKQYIAANRSNKSVINEIWDNKSAVEHAPLYINTIQIQKHSIDRYIELTQIVIVKTEELLELLK